MSCVLRLKSTGLIGGHKGPRGAVITASVNMTCEDLYFLGGFLLRNCGFFPQCALLITASFRSLQYK